MRRGLPSARLARLRMLALALAALCPVGEGWAQADGGAAASAPEVAPAAASSPASTAEAASTPSAGSAPVDAAAAPAADAPSSAASDPAAADAPAEAASTAASSAGDGEGDGAAPALGAAASEAASPASAASATVAVPAVPIPPGAELPRAYGHVIGDVLTQRLLLPAYTDAPAASVLPPAGRVGRWFERRPPVVETDDDGRRWLRLDYQVVNAPREPQVASLPALSLAVGSDTLRLPAWPVGLGPITVAADRLGGLPAWRGDRPWPAQETPAMTRRLHDTLLAFAALLLAWAGWWAWREWRSEADLPFARAWRVLRRAQASDPEAWRTLHRAIDATAGRVVHGASLPALLAERPALQPLREPLEGFYRASAARFFDGRGDTDGFPLRDLARSLRRVERAQHH